MDDDYFAPPGGADSLISNGNRPTDEYYLREVNSPHGTFAKLENSDDNSVDKDNIYADGQLYKYNEQGEVIGIIDESEMNYDLYILFLKATINTTTGIPIAAVKKKKLK